MKPSAAEVGFCAERPERAFNPADSDVKYNQERGYVDGPRELFQPSRRQIRNARSWLVRVIARRAVDILNAQETGP
ncbi:MAG TPA: hypothetical protein PLV57_20490 [Phycisphaerae bacterium]|nr:hypothetical protein [Phycisphaerae bacterium]HON68444.1 hypothetical protein [Phycisphaerae bacterium]HPP28893.1 hypothetical protein [Phycisphaerae bacterium]